MIPCKECIVYAICKHKGFIELMKCNILERILYHSQEDDNLVFHLRQHNYHDTLREIERTLQPTRWKYNIFSKEEGRIIK